MKMRAKNPVSSEGDVKGYAGFGAMIASQQLTTPTIEGILEVLFGPGINSEDRLDVLLALTRRKPTEVFWPVLHTAWANCDDTWHLRSRLLEELRSRNGHMAGVNFLSMEDREFLDNLPDPACVFRGCSKERVRGPAWTTDWKIAAGFARGHRGLGVPRPIIATALVYKRMCSRSAQSEKKAKCSSIHIKSSNSRCCLLNLVNLIDSLVDQSFSIAYVDAARTEADWVEPAKPMA